MARELIAERIAIGRRYVRAVDILRDLEDLSGAGRLRPHTVGSGRSPQDAGRSRKSVPPSVRFG